ncbi:3-(3-hydroxy-phenyl)propionate/3-hydroxycinnamic acid hydroxylase [Ilyonectria robusta]
METTDVIIVGAGPSGLALALALSSYKVRSVVLEKNRDICQDPRAIALAGDSHRIMELLGISSSKLSEFGQTLKAIHFHRDSFNNKPFLSVDSYSDYHDQSLPGATLILQPRLEEELRGLLQSSEYAQLRTECTVTSCREGVDSIEVSFTASDGASTDLRGRYLVGADGKRGIVRKAFLEPRGVEQAEGKIHYVAKWVAANLCITMPTPESHPYFPLWKLGYKPEEVWDIFWPEGFHFCNDPVMPVATGRFGPADERFWRFEYELTSETPLEEAERDVLKQLEAKMAPHLTIPAARLRRQGINPEGPVRFPWDCVEVLRCAPAYFSHRVVGQWSHNRTILIGDAAHVFPPFGAQGIANGVRDSLALSWRLALLCDESLCTRLSLQSHKLLDDWALERRKGVDDAMTMTMRNGVLLSNKSGLVAAVLGVLGSILKCLPRVRDGIARRALMDNDGYAGLDRGFFLTGQHGAGKTAQMWVKTADGPVLLSDHIFWKSASILTVLVLGSVTAQEASELKQVIDSGDLPPHVVADNVVILRGDESSCNSVTAPWISELFPCKSDDLEKMGVSLLRGYDPAAFRRRFLSSTRYVLVRPDFIVFSQAKTIEELAGQLRQAKELLSRQ